MDSNGAISFSVAMTYGKYSVSIFKTSILPVANLYTLIDLQMGLVRELVYVLHDNVYFRNQQKHY